MDKKVWYLSGASKGLGLALTHKLLTQGYRVAATSRLLPALVEATGGNTIENFLPLEVDLSDTQSIADSIRTTCKTFGRIDVVVNNARLGGVAHTVIPQAIPYLRRQERGYLIDIAPDAGSVDSAPFAGSVDSPPFAGSVDSPPFAGSVDSPPFAGSVDLDPSARSVISKTRFPDIRRTTVTLGAFHIQFLKNEDHAANAMYVSIDGRQPGDPQKAASALIRLPSMPEPPAFLVLDSDAYRKATTKTNELREQLEQRPRQLCRVAR